MNLIDDYRLAQQNLKGCISYRSYACCPKEDIDINIENIQLTMTAIFNLLPEEIQAELLMERLSEDDQ